MQVTTLKDPGINMLAQSVRREVARVISNLETSAPSVPAGLFAAFLSHAATVTPGYTGPFLPATQAVVANGGSVPVKNSAGTVTKTGTATVAAGAISGVALAATEAIVSNAGSVTVQNSAGSKVVTGAAAVAAGVVTNVALVATDAIIGNTMALAVQNSAGAAIPGTHNATVAAGLLSNVKLAATVGVVVNAVKQSGWTVTGTGTFFTPTIVAGVCTGGVLSAS